MPKYFDIHSHINFDAYDEDRGEALARLDEYDVFTTTVGTNLRTSKEAVELANVHERLFACIGLHPVDRDERDFNEADFEKLVENKKVVAIGETGLDYFHPPIGEAGSDESDKERQVKNFRAQIELALKHNLPLMIHCREAYSDTLDILEEYKRIHGGKLRGDMHFFAGDLDIAKRTLDIGFSLSFTGVVTFAKEYEELVKMVPLDRLMAETDAPFVAPAPMRGRRNEPTYVRYVYEKIAEIRDEEDDVVMRALTNNALRFFGI